MRRTIVGLVTAAVLTAFGWGNIASVSAAETAPPKLAQINSFSEQFTMSFDGAPMAYCQARYESIRRFYTVCKSLADLERYHWKANQVIETLQYDSKVYVRQSDGMWLEMAVENYNPNTSFDSVRFAPHGQAVLSDLGAARVAGQSATHYQYWYTAPNVNTTSGQRNYVKNGQAVYDIFVSPDGLVLSDSFSSRGEHWDFGQGMLTFESVYSDINTPITVAAPAADQIRR